MGELQLNDIGEIVLNSIDEIYYDCVLLHHWVFSNDSSYTNENIVYDTVSGCDLVFPNITGFTFDVGHKAGTESILGGIGTGRTINDLIFNLSGATIEMMYYFPPQQPYNVIFTWHENISYYGDGLGINYLDNVSQGYPPKIVVPGACNPPCNYVITEGWHKILITIRYYDEDEFYLHTYVDDVLKNPIWTYYITPTNVGKMVFGGNQYPGNPKWTSNQKIEYLKIYGSFTNTGIVT